MKSRSKLWSIFLAMILISLPACQSQEVDTTDEEAVPVETAEVVSGSLDGEQKISGTTEMLAEVALTPSHSAEIVDIRVEKGEEVERGQVLALLDDTDLQHALEQEKAARERARSGVAISEAGEKRAAASKRQSEVALENADHAITQAREQYEQAKTNLEQAKENYSLNISAAERTVETAERNLQTAEREYERSKELYDAGLISAQELEQAEAAVEDVKDNVADAKENLEKVKQQFDIDVLESEVNRARSAWEQAKDSKKELQANIDAAGAGIDEASAGIEDAKAGLSQADIAVEQAEERLEDAVVRAPSSGKVIDVTGEEGEFYAQQEPLITLGQLNSLNLVATVTPYQLMLFEEGDEVEVHFPSVEMNKTGTITHIASTADENGFFAVEVHIDNEDESLQAGIYGELIITETYVEDSLLIPTESLIEVEGTTSVFVKDGDRAKLVPVEVIREESDITAVQGELDVGDLVITRGQYFLEDGSLIEDVTDETAEEAVEDRDEEGEETSSEEDQDQEEEQEEEAYSPSNASLVTYRESHTGGEHS